MTPEEIETAVDTIFNDYPTELLQLSYERGQLLVWVPLHGDAAIEASAEVGDDVDLDSLPPINTISDPSSWVTHAHEVAELPDGEMRARLIALREKLDSVDQLPDGYERHVFHHPVARPAATTGKLRKRGHARGPVS